MKRKAVTLQLEGEIPQPQSAYDLAVEEGYEGNEEQYGKELATIPPTQEQFDAIPGRLSKLTTTTEKSDFHHITDSAADKVVDFGMEGKTEQNTTSGKNLWNNEYARDVNNWSKVEGSNYPSIPVFVGAGNVITASYKQQLAGGLGFYFAISRDGMHNNLYDWMYHSSTTSLIKNETTFTAESDYIYPCYYEQKNLDLFMQYIGNDLQIEINPVATDYEPYTNGPSPNPDYPQEIVNAGVYNEATGRYEIGCRVGNGNLLPYPYHSGDEYDNKGCKFVVNDDASITVSGTSTNGNSYFWITGDTKETLLELPAGTYILSDEKYDKNGDATYSISNLEDDGHYNYLTLNKPFTFTKPFKLRVCVQVQYKDTANATFHPTLNVGPTVLPFKKPQSQPFTLTSPVPLTKWDKLVKKDGVWGWSIWDREIEVNINSKLNANIYPNGDLLVIVAESNVEDYEVVCEIFSGVAKVWGAMSVNEFTYHNDRLRFHITPDIATTLDEFKVWLAQNPFKVQVKALEEQAFHPLPDEEQELLRNLETYYGVTNLYNDQGCPMWLTYVQDTKAAIDNKFNNIRQAVLSLGGNV